MYVFEINDNAKINADSQFSGVRMVPDSCHYTGESHLKNIRQLTFGGTNLRPSVSPDDRYIVFQAHGIEPNSCDQIYRLPISTGVPAGRISSGKGEAGDAVFLSEDEMVYTSTEAYNNGACPERASVGSDLYVSDTNGKELKRLTKDSTHFTGGAAVSPNGKNILFTRTIGGMPQILSMNRDGSGISQITHVGFDGEPAYSPDGTLIAVAGWHSKAREIYIMDEDGSHGRQLTHLGGINSLPCWAPPGNYIAFEHRIDKQPSPNLSWYPSDLFVIKTDGTGLERITDGGGFNGFPVFTHDGKQLIFCSSRNAAHPGDVNIFVADWVP